MNRLEDAKLLLVMHESAVTKNCESIAKQGLLPNNIYNLKRALASYDEAVRECKETEEADVDARLEQIAMEISCTIAQRSLI